MLNVSNELRIALAPTGVLRVTINTGNPILAGKRDGANQPHGISVDLARLISEKLGTELELLVFDAAGKAVEAVTENKADMGFFALDPARAQHIAFTPPYVLIEGCYLVSENSPILSIEEVDHSNNRVVVGKGSAYDLFLSRNLSNAALVRSPTSPEVVAYYLKHEMEVAAGVKQQLETGITEFGGLRLLPRSFMTIEQALGVPIGRPAEVVGFLSDFIEEMKAQGVVKELMERHGIKGASVAPVGKSAAQ